MAEAVKLKEANRRFWDTNPCGGDWPSYEAFRQWVRAAEPYAFELLESEDWNGMQVLEVGCGQGTLLNYLPGLGAGLTIGLDASLESLRRARDAAASLELERMVFLHGDAEHLPFEDASFDRVLSIGVLHHTPDTAGSVRELHRVLSPGGRAIVMLYRSGNPKWWATKALRGGSALVDRVTGSRGYLASRLRSRQEAGDPAGTALLELFGCPTLKAFSNREVRRMFSEFASVSIENVQPGFDRLADVIPGFGPLRSLLRRVDHITAGPWGFYQVIRAERG